MKLMGGFVGLWAALFPLEICLFGSPGGGSRGVLGRLGGSRGILGEPGVSREAFWTVLGPSLGGVLGLALGPTVFTQSHADRISNFLNINLKSFFPLDIIYSL